MPKFKRKLSLVDAELYNGTDLNIPGLQVDQDGIVFVDTLYGSRVPIKNGEWIVKDSLGNFYVLDDKTFRDIYELAEEF